MERDESGKIKSLRKKDFNSHAHVERDIIFAKNKFRISHFNSHAHVERDIPVIHIMDINAISTHTLTWSVTSNEFGILPLLQFQLTRSRGA